MSLGKVSLALIGINLPNLNSMNATNQLHNATAHSTEVDHFVGY